MDNVKFEHDELVATKNIPVVCNVTVTPVSNEENFTLTLEISGTDVFFITPGGTSNKSFRTFDSNGFMKPRLCEMDLRIGSNKPGFTITTIAARTQNSNRTEIKLMVNDDSNV